MSSAKGYPSSDAEKRTEMQHQTVEPVRAKQNGTSVQAHMYVTRITAAAVVASGSTTTVVNSTAHAAKRGDVIYFRSGALSGVEAKVLSIPTVNSIELVEILSVAPSAADTFDVLRNKYPLIDAEGSISVSTTSAPIQYNLNSSATTVARDSVTPANTRALPVTAYTTGGVETGTSASPVRTDPTGTTTQPVLSATADVLSGAVNETAPATDTASSGLNGRLQRIAQRLTSTIALLPASLGAKVSASSLAVVLASDQATVPVLSSTADVLTGAVTETAPATDTASSGLNGRLQRIAQRLTSLIALVPASLGSKTSANSFAVVIASDQGNVPVNAAQINGVTPLMGNGTTGTGSMRVTLASDTTSNSNPFLVELNKAAASTLTNVASSASSASLLASNASRKGMMIWNDSTSTLYLKFGATASTTSCTVKIAPDGYFEMLQGRPYTGAVDGIWAAANGSARITELT